MKIFGTQNAKTTKGEPLGYRTLIRYLAPSDISGTNVCPNAGACRQVCLYFAGRGGMDATQKARIAKTRHRLERSLEHLHWAAEEIEAALKSAKKAGLKLAVRANGTSDLVGDSVALALKFPDVQFYDYTKIVAATRVYGAVKNLHWTLSYDPETVPESVCREALQRGTNVAVVCSGEMPAEVWGYPTLDGDAHDLRFLDAPGHVVALKAKGPARLANSFVL